MPETLRSPSSVLLFGREVLDLEVLGPKKLKDKIKDRKVEQPFEGVQEGKDSEQKEQPGTDSPRFARIYGFSYEGAYYDLPTPTLFLVHGDGVEASKAIKVKEIPGGESLARAPGSVSRTGLAAMDFQFAKDLRVWSYDQADYTIRMDVASGRFEQVLLGPELDDDSIEALMSGQRVRVSGQRARVSGQRARVSGQRVRIRDRGSD